MAYHVSLENFEGPFDLLLFLIQKNRIDIYDIPIAEITRQYLQTIMDWQELDLDIASEFITMAARLMEIKAYTLLPIRQDNAEAEAEADLKTQLVTELIEYQTFKNISRYFQERERTTLGTVVKEPEYLPKLETEQKIEIDPQLLLRILKRVTDLYRDDHAYKPVSGKIQKDVYRIEDKITLIKEKLQFEQEAGFSFSELVTAGDRQEVVVAFQALLECYKTGRIRVRQFKRFGEIMIFRENDR